MRRQWKNKSRLLTFPKEILKKVNQMLIEEGEEQKTYQEIADWLKEQGYKTSKSAVGRYANHFYAQRYTEKIGIVRKDQLTNKEPYSKKVRLYQLLAEIEALFDSKES